LGKKGEKRKKREERRTIVFNYPTSSDGKWHGKKGRGERKNPGTLFMLTRIRPQGEKKKGKRREGEWLSFSLQPLSSSPCVQDREKKRGKKAQPALRCSACGATPGKKEKKEEKRGEKGQWLLTAHREKKKEREKRE